MKHVVLILTVLPLLLGGCDLSNELFEEDALFLRAVPGVEDLRTEHPSSRDSDGELVDDEASGERGGGDEVWAQIPPQAHGIASGINGHVFGLLGIVDFLRSEPITTRARNRRFWGPYPYEPSGGSVRMLVMRDPESPNLFEYVIAFSWDAPEDVDEDSAWDAVLVGEFSRGSLDGPLRDGIGAYCFNAEAAAAYDPDWGGGRMCVEHQRIGDRITLWVELYDWLQVDGSRTRLSYYFRHLEDRGGVLEYVTYGDMVGQDGLPERLATRVRWRRGHAGRADLLLSGGSLLGGGVPATECWSSQFLRTFWIVGPADDPFEQYGDEIECAFPEREDVREID